MTIWFWDTAQYMYFGVVDMHKINCSGHMKGAFFIEVLWNFSFLYYNKISHWFLSINIKNELTFVTNLVAASRPGLAGCVCWSRPGVKQSPCCATVAGHRLALLRTLRHHRVLFAIFFLTVKANPLLLTSNSFPFWDPPSTISHVSIASSITVTGSSSDIELKSQTQTHICPKSVMLA